MAMTFDKVRFLVVDDHENTIQIVRTLLKAFGADKVTGARSVAEAIDRMKTDRFDVVICDWLMPTRDGMAFLKAVRNERTSTNPFIPVIMLTAYTEYSRVEAMRDAGAHEVCAKPITAAELYRKIVSLVDDPRPFVRTAGYFGPDRRRKQDTEYRGPERRASGLDAALDEPEAPQPRLAAG
jgi:CheY-like chemotaxis protein